MQNVYGVEYICGATDNGSKPKQYLHLLFKHVNAYRECPVACVKKAHDSHLNHFLYSFLFCMLLREPDGQASGGNDFGNDNWIFTIREKDPKKLQNGASSTGDEVGDGSKSPDH